MASSLGQIEEGHGRPQVTSRQSHPPDKLPPLPTPALARGAVVPPLVACPPQPLAIIAVQRPARNAPRTDRLV
jgi:hypothetical protein